MAMTTKQVLNLSMREVSKMTEKELRQATSVLRSTARKRYERLSDQELYTPALQNFVKRSASKDSVLPSVKDMDLIKLRNEFKRYKTFLNAKTSTVSGAKKVAQATKSVMKDITGVEMTDEDLTMFYSLYDEAKQTGVGGVLNYKQVMEEVANVYDKNPNLTRTELLSQIENNLQKAYERENPTNELYTSLYFDNDSD